jgi:hypothetical protein
MACSYELVQYTVVYAFIQASVAKHCFCVLVVVNAALWPNSRPRRDESEDSLYFRNRQVIGLNILYFKGLEVADSQYMIQDLLVVTSTATLMGYTGPRPNLSNESPPPRLLVKEVVSPSRPLPLSPY